MANEAKLVFETALPIPFTVANGTGIEKGTLLAISDLMTAAAAVENDSIAGIAASEKIANDGNTKLGVYRQGIFRMAISGAGALTVGTTVAASGSNCIKTATAANVGSDILGIALETGADTETILVELNIGANNNAYT